MTSVVLDSENGDIFIDEQTSLRVTVNTIFPDGTPRDITEAEIVWVASLNGEQKMRKDTDTMQIMLAPQTATVITENASAGDTVINVAKTSNFGGDPWGRPIANFAVGDYVVLADAFGASPLNEQAIVTHVTDLTVTLASPISFNYPATDSPTFSKIVSQFSFIILPGDTILPGNKVLGTKIVYDHYGYAVYPTGMSPENIDAIPMSVTVVRGDMFIDPIPDMSP